jgi:hypothetical protein
VSSLPKTAAKLYEAVQALLIEAAQLFEAGSAGPAGTLPAARAPDLLAALDRQPSHPSTAEARNAVASMLNHSASALVVQLGPAADDPAAGWLATAAGYAVEPGLSRTIAENREVLSTMVSGFEAVRSRVGEFVASGRPDLARQFLVGLPPEMAGQPGAHLVEEMLAALPPAGRRR